MAHIRADVPPTFAGVIIYLTRRILAGVDSAPPVSCSYCIMLRTQARASLRALEQRGSLYTTGRVQAASISTSSTNLIASSRHQHLASSPLSSTAAAFPLIPGRTMSTHFGESAVRPEPDKVVQDIADYVHNYKINSDLAWETARLCLIDTIGCGLEGLRFPECRNLLGPVVEGTIVPNGEYHPPYPSSPRAEVRGPTHSFTL
jgi:2-methylcitrate dehydratase